MPEMLATYIFISNVLCVVGSYFAPRFTKLLKSGKMCTVVVFFIMALMMIAARLMVDNAWAVVILMSLAQFGYGVVYAVAPALYADTVIYAQWKTGKNAAGWISGLQLFPLKIGFVVRGVAIPAILAAAGFVSGMDPSEATATLQAGICDGFISIPAAILVVAGAILLFCYKLTPDKLQRYQDEIDARSADANNEIDAQATDARDENGDLSPN